MAKIPSFPSIDLSKLDLSKLDLSKLDLTKVGLPKIDTAKLRELNIAGIDGEKVIGLLRDAVYVVIGAGVLTVQQLQVRRRELTERLGANPVVKQLGLSKEQLDDVVRGVEARMAAFDERMGEIEQKYDARVEALLSQLEGRLPEQAGAMLGQAHGLAKATRKQVRGLIRNAA
jgi:hypothetical protein